jgi:putative endonuclease
MRTYYVYSMASTAGRTATLYTGVTNNLERRVWEHRTGRGSAFVTKYGVRQLV